MSLLNHIHLKRPQSICQWKLNYCTNTLMVHNLVFTIHACCRQLASRNCFHYVCSVVSMILSIHSSLGYVPQYSQNPSQFPAGPTHQPVYSHPGYPPTGSQYPPQQGYYYGQPAPSTQLPPVGAEVPPHQYTGAAMQGPSYQGSV